MDSRGTENPRKSRIFTQLLDLCGSRPDSDSAGSEAVLLILEIPTMTAIRLTRSVYLDLRFLPITSMWNPLQKDSPRLDRLNLFLLSSAALYFLSLVLAFILIRIFVLAPFEVGGSRFFIENSMEKAGLGNILFGFQNGYYGKTVWTLFLKNLYIFLWSLLLLIPGIVKAYEYHMVPYLLADYPELSTEEAFRISREMMSGEKMNTFILDLSFIGWYILSGITCNLVGIFYLYPYKYATDAELFLVLKQNYFSSRSYGNTYQAY